MANFTQKKQGIFFFAFPSFGCQGVKGKKKYFCTWCPKSALRGDETKSLDFFSQGHPQYKVKKNNFISSIKYLEFIQGLLYIVDDLSENGLKN